MEAAAAPSQPVRSRPGVKSTGSSSFDCGLWRWLRVKVALCVPPVRTMTFWSSNCSVTSRDFGRSPKPFGMTGSRCPPPVPPVHLRKRVHGAEDKESFDDIGRIISDTVFSYLKVDDCVERFRGLDFGAGCGRVLAPLDQLCRKNSSSHNVIEWYGSDIDRPSYSMVSKKLGFNRKSSS